MIELCKLAFRYAKQKWTQTLVVVIGSLLSVLLITSVILLNNTLQKQKEQSFTTASGAWTYRITSQDMKLVNQKTLENFKIEEEVRISHLGFIELEHQSFVEVKGYSKFNDLQPIQLKQGTYPKNEHEILISNRFKKANKLHVGDIISYDLGKRTRQTKEEVYNDWLHEDETFVKTDKKEFRICGIYNETKSPGESVIKDTFITKTELNVEPFITYFAIEKVTPEDWNILKRSLPTNALNNVSKDLFIKRTVHITTKEVIVYALSFVILGINLFMFTKNVFTIFLQQKRRFLGALLCCGASHKKIIIVSVFDSLLIGVISIPIGILLAYVFVDNLLSLLNQVLFSQVIDYVLQIQFENVLYLNDIIFIVLISTTLLVMSSLFPLKSILKEQPLRLLQDRDKGIKSNEIKEYKWYERYFQVSAMLGKRNQYYNRKKYRSICLTLTISFVMLLCGNFISSSLSNRINNSQTGIEVMLPPFQNSNDIQRMENTIHDLRKINKNGEMNGYYFLDVNTNKIPLGFWEDTAYVQELEKNPCIRVYTLVDLTALPAMLKKDHNIILLNDTQILSKDGTKISIDVFNKERIHDTLAITDQYFIGDNTWHKETMSFKIINIEDSMSYGIRKSNIKEDDQLYSFSVLVNPSDFEALLTMYENRAQVSDVILTMRSKHNVTLYNALQAYKEKFPYRVSKVKDLQKSTSKEQSLIMIYQLVFSSFAILALLIGFINLLNTMISNLLSQKRMYMILQSVGMNDKKLQVMLLFENMGVVLKSILLGTLLSTLINYVMYKVLFYIYGDFHINWLFIMQISSMIIIMSVLIVLLTNYIMNKNRTLYDAMKQES